MKKGDWSMAFSSVNLELLSSRGSEYFNGEKGQKLGRKKNRKNLRGLNVHLVLVSFLFIANLKMSGNDQPVKQADEVCVA